MTPPPPITPSTSVALDLLRAVLAQLVLAGHAISLFGVLPWLQPPWYPPMQSFAVVGFFWLSGFLISHSVLSRLDRPGYDFRHFAIDRFARIYSGYLPAMAAIVLLDLLFIRLHGDAYPFTRHFDLATAVQNLLMLQKFPLGFLSAPLFGSGSTWWTLGIEWWMYMFFGWLLLGVARARPGRWRLAVLALLAVVPVGYTVAGTGHVGHGLALMWLLAAGLPLLLAPLARVAPPGLLPPLAGLFLVLCLVRLAIADDAFDMIASLLSGIALLCLCGTLQARPSARLLRLRAPAAWIAGYSFTLFLTHYPVLLLLQQACPGGGWTPLVAGIVISNLLALAIAWPTEMRHRTLARWLHRRLGPARA